MNHQTQIFLKIYQHIYGRFVNVCVNVCVCVYVCIYIYIYNTNVLSVEKFDHISENFIVVKICFI
jgi:hypothetical protein